MTITEIERSDRIKRCEGQRMQCQSYAAYWTAYANSPLVRSDADRQKECFATALRHIHRMDELTESICSLTRGEEPAPY